MRVDWCVSSWFRIKNTHSLTVARACRHQSVPRSPIPRWCPVRAWLFFTFLHTYIHESEFVCLCVANPWLGRALLVVVRILRSAIGAASEWRPPLAWCVEASPEILVTTGGRLQLPERGRLDPGTLGISCAHRAGPQPLGQLLWEPPQGRRMRRRWIDPAAQGLALSSPPRARCSRSAACRTATSCRAATRCCSCTASPGQPSSTRCGPLRGRGAPRRISSESRRGSRMRLKAPPATCGLAHARLRVHKYPGRSRATAPGAGWDISS